MTDNNKRNKVKGIGLSLTTGVLSIGAFASPVSVFANELVGYDSKDVDSYGFNYKKNGKPLHEDLKTEGASYMLVLRKGIDEEGREFEPTTEQILEASIPFKANKDQSRINVKYRGLYDLISINREPGYFPVKDSLFLDEGLIEFPKPDKDADKIITLKEDLFIPEFETILRNPENIGLRGDFELHKVASPREVFSKDIADVIGIENDADKNKLKEKIKNAGIGYHPSVLEDEVRGWVAVDENKGIIRIDENASVKWKIDKEDEGEVEFAKRLDGGLTEGVYSIVQKSSEVGYSKRAKGISFKVTINSNNEPILEFVDNFINPEEISHGEDIYPFSNETFYKEHDLEYFKLKDYKDGSTARETLYQTLLVNFPIIGLEPIKPTDPNDPNPNRPNPNEPAYKNAFTKEGYKYENENIKDDRDKVYEENTIMQGEHIKVNVGEKFGLQFDIQIPENLDEYNKFVFADPIDDRIEFGDSYTKEYEEYWEDYYDGAPDDEEEPDEEEEPEAFFSARATQTIPGKARYFGIPNTDFIENYPVQIYADGINLAEKFNLNKVLEVKVSKDGKKGVSLVYDSSPKHSEDIEDFIKGKKLTIKIEDLHLKEGTREDVKNRAYIYYDIKDKENTIPEDPMEHPDGKNVLDPNKPGYPLEEDPDNPINENNVVDPNNPNKPFIPTTPEIIIDPITVDFRMGVVDQSTNILNNATYEIVEFTPSRGDGGIENGELYIGKEKIGIKTVIDDEDVKNGFVKLADLPAGRYRMVETTAPVKGDQEYRLVTQELVFHVNEDEEFVYIESPIVKNGNEALGKKINAKELYREGDTDERNLTNWNNPEVNNKEAMLHHYRYINTPETGTLAGIPFFLGGGVLVSAGIAINKKKKEEK